MQLFGESALVSSTSDKAEIKASKDRKARQERDENISREIAVGRNKDKQTARKKKPKTRENIIEISIWQETRQKPEGVIDR